MADEREEWFLRLYVAGMTPTARITLDRLRRLCDEDLPGNPIVEVVDLTEKLAVAEELNIFAVPMVIRHRPEPVQRVVGDLSDRRKALAGLGVVRDGS